MKSRNWERREHEAYGGWAFDNFASALTKMHGMFLFFHTLLSTWNCSDPLVSLKHDVTMAFYVLALYHSAAVKSACSRWKSCIVSQKTSASWIVWLTILSIHPSSYLLCRLALSYHVVWIKTSCKKNVQIYMLMYSFIRIGRTVTCMTHFIFILCYFSTYVLWSTEHKQSELKSYHIEQFKKSQKRHEKREYRYSAQHLVIFFVILGLFTTFTILYVVISLLACECEVQQNTVLSNIFNSSGFYIQHKHTKL